MRAEWGFRTSQKEYNESRRMEGDFCYYECVDVVEWMEAARRRRVGNKLLAQVGEDASNFIQTFRGALARMNT